MDRENRVFGNNMRFYSHQKGRRLKWLAEQLECSEYDVQKMMDARFFLDREEQERVAEILLDLFDTYCDVQEVLAEEGLKFP